MSLFFSLPLPFLLFIILAICLLVGIGGNSLVRRMGWQVTTEDNEAINLTHALAGVLYAVALGLMVVNVQSGYTEVKLVVMKEANLIEDLYIDAHGLSDEEGEEIQALIEAYVGSIIDEWHEIGDRSDSELPSHKLVEELTREFLAYEPKTDKDLVIYAEMLGGFNDKMDSLCQSFGIIVPRIIFSMKESIQCSVRPLVLISQSLFSKFPLQTEIKKS